MKSKFLLLLLCLMAYIVAPTNVFAEPDGSINTDQNFDVNHKVDADSCFVVGDFSALRSCCIQPPNKAPAILNEGITIKKQISKEVNIPDKNRYLSLIIYRYKTTSSSTFVKYQQQLYRHS